VARRPPSAVAAIGYQTDIYDFEAVN
jgi:hypothetical protein